MGSHALWGTLEMSLSGPWLCKMSVSPLDGQLSDGRALQSLQGVTLVSLWPTFWEEAGLTSCLLIGCCCVLTWVGRSPAPAGDPETGSPAPAVTPSRLSLTCCFPPCRANLSDSYFTNRQDRYVFLQDCPEIADFFTELVDAVGDVSLQLQGDDSVQMVEGMVHPYKGRAGPAASQPGVVRAPSRGGGASLQR